MTTSLRTRLTQTTRLRVQKRTGSPGDTLIAWGLAIVASEVHRRPVELSNAPDAFHITLRTTPEQLRADCQRYQPTTRVMLPWLASTEKGRFPAETIAYHVDRDMLRDDEKRITKRGQRPDIGGDAAAAAGHVLASKYPLFQALTNPGKQWTGYNTFVNRIAPFWSAAGVEMILNAFVEVTDDVAFDAKLDGAMRAVGLTTSGDRRRNPPGFLFPGGNKGPTMRLDQAGVVVGQAGALDWMLANRGDLSTVELYLAYIGYFALGVVITSKESQRKGVWLRCLFLSA